MRQTKTLLMASIAFCWMLISAGASAAGWNKGYMPWITALLLDDNVKIAISGKATIPNYTPKGKLIVLVDGLDGKIYGAALTDKDGNYSVKASVPKTLQRVYVLAVDPSDPNYYTAAYVSLAETDVSQSLLSMDEPGIGVRSDASTGPNINKDLDAATLAASLISDFTGVHWTEEEQAHSDIQASILADEFQPRFCTEKKTKDINELLVALAKKHVDDSLSDRLRAYARAASPVLSRLNDGGQDINSHITSSNWERNRLGPAGIGMLVGGFALGPVGFGAAGIAVGGGAGVFSANYNENQVVKTGNLIERFGFSSITGYAKGWATQEDLEAAVNLIYRHGYGNCQEKGLVAAYFASLFGTDEFRQVAHVVAMTGKHSWFGSAEHSFAIACTEDQSVYDLQNLPDVKIENNRVKLPQAFFDARCYLVDPWAQYMVRLNEFEVEFQEWEEIFHVMGVSNRNQAKSSSPLQMQSETPAYLSQYASKPQSCPVNLVCDVCSNRNDTNSRVCQAWVPLPENGPPEADSQSVIVYKNTAKGITLSGSDAENDPLSYSVVDQPDHGTLSGNPPGLTYTPDEDYTGPDSFSFVTSDGNSKSPQATVSINVITEDYVVYTVDSWTCFDAKIVTVGSRSDFQKDELLCNYHYYADNTCTVTASKTEMQGGFGSRADGYEWLDDLKGEWMLNRWCPGNGYYRLSGKAGWYMIF